jgi:hypothetical protein
MNKKPIFNRTKYEWSESKKDKKIKTEQVGSTISLEIKIPEKAL